MEEARRALSWVRGWTSTDNVEDEYRINLEQFSRHQEFQLGKPKKRIFRSGVMKPFFLITCMFLINSFNGQGPIFTYAVVIFKSFQLPVDEYTITMSMAGFYLLGIISSVYVVAALGKKLPTLWSVAVGGFATLTVVIYDVMYRNNIIVNEVNKKFCSTRA